MVRSRIKALIALLLLPAGILLGRLGWVQLWPPSRARYERLSFHQAKRFLAPRRGRILDRNSRILAGNQPVFEVRFRYSELNPRRRPLEVLAAELKQWGFEGDEAALEERILQLAEPELLARQEDPEDSVETDGAAPQARPWLLLCEGLPKGCARRLEERLREEEPIFAVRQEAGSGSFQLWFEPRRTAAMEITLHRLADLCGAQGVGGAGYTELCARVEAALKEIEESTDREVAQKRESSDLRPALEASLRRTILRIHYRSSRSLLGDAPPGVVTEIECRGDRFEGLECEDGVRRVYPFGEASGALLGRLKAIGGDDLDHLRKEHQAILDERSIETMAEFEAVRAGALQKTDRLGEGGLESRHESTLRGTYGLCFLSRARGRRPARVLEEVLPLNGEDVVTTLDAKLQEKLYRELERKVTTSPGALRPLSPTPEGSADGGTGAGAATSTTSTSLGSPGAPRGTAIGGCVAVMELPSGALLASAGFPGFVPARLSEAGYAESMNRSWGAGWQLDRPLHQAMAPGSVFKVITALAALEPAGDGEEPLDPGQRYPCLEAFAPIPSLHCSAAHGHNAERQVDLVDALRYSCNNYFYALAWERVAPDRMDAWAWNLGLGRSTGIDLPSLERIAAGALRGPKATGSRGIACQYAIGQACVTATPLQVLRAYAAIGVGGRFVPRPYLVTPSEPDALVLRNPRTIPTLREGLWRVAHAPGGTASNSELLLGSYNVALKTGTAEVDVGEETYHNAWVAGFAPFDHPRIAFVAVIEQVAGLHGGEACAPLVKTILDHCAEELPGRWRLEEPPAQEVVESRP